MKVLEIEAPLFDIFYSKFIRDSNFDIRYSIILFLRPQMSGKTGYYLKTFRHLEDRNPISQPGHARLSGDAGRKKIPAGVPDGSARH